MIAREGWTLALDVLVPFAHWVTPHVEARRFDTRFFVIRAPDRPDPAPRCDGNGRGRLGLAGRRAGRRGGRRDRASRCRRGAPSPISRPAGALTKRSPGPRLNPGSVESRGSFRRASGGCWCCRAIRSILRRSAKPCRTRHGSFGRSTDGRRRSRFVLARTMLHRRYSPGLLISCEAWLSATPMRTPNRIMASLVATIGAVALTHAQRAPGDGLRFEIVFPRTAHATPVTGRVYVMISSNAEREPRLEIGQTGIPFFGRDVERLAPGQAGRDRRNRSRLSHRKPARLPARRVLRAGLRQRLLRIPPRRRSRRLDARRPVGGTALGTFRRATCTAKPQQHQHRSRRPAA